MSFSLQLSDKLHKDIQNYCILNEIKDIDAFCIKMLVQGFTIEKHGMTPFIKQSPILSKEEIKETINDEIPQVEKEEIKKPKKVKIIKK